MGTVGSPFRRPRRHDDAPTPRDEHATLPPGNPLEELLGQVQDLRLTLATDLTAAAGAADAGADQVARDIIEADQRELARFARVANIDLERLSGRRVQAAKSPAWRRRVAASLPVVPVVGAMALSAAAATGALPIPGGADRHSASDTTATVAPDESGPATTLRALANVLDGDPSASQVIAAASKLHKQLRHLIDVSPNDPGQAAEIVQLLRMEQSLLLQKLPPGADVVLSATRKLAARLVTVVPHHHHDKPSVDPTLIPGTTPSSQHHKHHSSSPSPAPSAQPTAVDPSPQPSSRPSSSPSPSNSPIAFPQ